MFTIKEKSSFVDIVVPIIFVLVIATMIISIGMSTRLWIKGSCQVNLMHRLQTAEKTFNTELMIPFITFVCQAIRMEKTLLTG